jgi:hypothetical protein
MNPSQPWPTMDSRRWQNSERKSYGIRTEVDTHFTSTRQPNGHRGQGMMAGNIQSTDSQPSMPHAPFGQL